MGQSFPALLFHPLTWGSVGNGNRRGRAVTPILAHSTGSGQALLPSRGKGLCKGSVSRPQHCLPLARALNYLACRGGTRSRPQDWGALDANLPMPRGR